MVPLVAVPSEFAGQVICAKLGSAGIIAELRGISRVYPTLLGKPEVWVEATEWADACELVRADTDDELAPEPERVARPLPRRPSARPAFVAVAVLLLASFALAPRACGGPPATRPARPPSRGTP